MKPFPKAGIFDIFVAVTALAAFVVLLVEKTAALQPYALIVGEFNLFVSLVFCADVLLRFLSFRNKRDYLAHNWSELVVVLPLINLLLGRENTPFTVIVRQAAIVVVLLASLRKSSKLLSLVSLKPAQMLVVTFAFAIGAGTILLMLPAATRAGVRMSLTDALFTATSATCVTGLAVRDTAAYFSFFGQTVILALIQVGGLGIMTFSVSLLLLLRKNVDMKQQAAMQDVLDSDALAHVKQLIKFIVKMTFWIEFCGAVALFVAWNGRVEGVFERSYASIFHAVSAFCNAGFSTFSDNLAGFSGHPATNIIISCLIISGGLGFLVVKDLKDWVNGRAGGRGRRSPLKVQTKIVLASSFLLIAAGAVLLYAAEKHHLLVYASPGERFWAPVFQSVSSRTAGFNTLAIGSLSSASMLVIIALMFIGGSPGSTAGGIKTTTFSVLLFSLLNEVRGRQEVEFFRRSVSAEIVRKAGMILVFSLLLVGVFSLSLMLMEKQPFEDILFETVSAFGTVGLSTGITPFLSREGKWLIIVLMFIGRIGPLTMGYAFLRLRRQAAYRYAEETVAIG